MKKYILLIFAAVILSASGVVSAQTGFQEVKLRSQVFNGAVVGKTVAPYGWQVYLNEFTLNPESITWPNMLYVTAVSPDGSVTLKYISRRKFQQGNIYMYGFTSQSEDDSFDQSSMLHTLNYRNAGDSCDYMVNVLYPDTYNTFISETPLSVSDIAVISQYQQLYDSNIRNVFSAAGGSMEVKGTEVSIAERIYQSGNSQTIVSGMVSGFEVVTYTDANTYTDYINWDMDCIYAMQAPAAVFEEYRSIFDVFVLNTYTSREYAAMTDRHSQELYDYYMKLKAGEPVDPEQVSASLDRISGETVGSGDSYSAIEGWSDVIREENDYRLSSGAQIKLPTAFDHVYEGDDGTVYAGFGSYYPEGTTELFPTAVGD